MVIFLLRHVESKFNRYPLLKEYDCGVTEFGKEQASNISLPNIKFDEILISPLKRVQETLLYLQIDKTINVKILNELREVKKDICDFYNNEEIIYESEKEILLRIMYIKTYLNENINKNILIIGHADLFWYLTSYVKDEERFGKWLENGEIFQYNLI